MPLFECGGANILQDIAISPKPTEQVTVIADQLTPSYDGIRRIAVAQFTNNDTRPITTNGPYSTLDGTGKAYLNFDVNVPLSIDGVANVNYVELFNGSASQGAPKEINYNASNYIFMGYKYVEVIATNSEWHRPRDGEIIPGGPTQTRRALVPLSSTETNWGAIGFYVQINGGGPSYAVVPFLVQPTRITLGSPVDPPVPSTDPDFVQHLWNVGIITKVRLIR